MSSTVSNVRRSDGSRFYTITGEPVYEIPKKRGDGMKKPTITDAIEHGWLPSVTTVIKTINKPQLNDWLINQAVKAIMDTPRRQGESNDEFVYRVLEVERVQDDYADKAAQLGTDIHKAIEAALNEEAYDNKFEPYVLPVLQNLKILGRKVWSEKILVGEGYAGRSDYLGEDKESLTLVDFKTSAKMPQKGAYAEHRMQTAAYARTLKSKKPIRTLLLYISTTTPGLIVPHLDHNWERAYEAFNHQLHVWRFMNGIA